MMVNRNDIPEINALIVEYNAIRQAIINIDAGGSITSMVISPPLVPSIATPYVNEPPPLLPAQVPTTYIKAPPIMYETIVELMETRRRDISTQLNDLGVVS